MLDGLQTPILIADKGYISHHLRQLLQARGITQVIPPRRTDKVHPPCDPAIYKQRNKIERMFSKLKDFRRFATRYDRRDTTFAATVNIAAAMLWLNYLYVD